MELNKPNYFKQTIKRFLAYVITPLMFASIGWLTKDFSEHFKENDSTLLVSFFVSLLILAFVLFCMTVITNLQEKDPENPISFEVTHHLVGRILVFFILTFIAAFCVNTLSGWLEDIMKLQSESKLQLLGLIAFSFSLWLADLFTVPDRSIRSLFNHGIHWGICGRFLVGLIFSVLLLIDAFKFSATSYLTYLHFSNEVNQQTAKQLYFGLLTIYSVYLFMRVTRTFVKPFNKLVEDNSLKAHQNLIVFLSEITTTIPWPNMTTTEQYQKSYAWLKAHYAEIQAEINQLLLLPEDKRSDVKIIEKFGGSDLFKKNDMLLIFVFFQIRCSADIMQQHNNNSLLRICDELDLLYRFKWEQTLRGIAYHLQQIDHAGKINRAKLESLTILVSKKTKTSAGSVSSVFCFVYCLQLYLQAMNYSLSIAIGHKSFRKQDTSHSFKCLPVNWPLFSPQIKLPDLAGIDFTSYSEVTEALDYILGLPAIKELGYSNTVVDVTSGPKTTSVAGALAATVMDIKNQYVDTNDKKQVKGYDFQYVDPTKSA